MASLRTHMLRALDGRSAREQARLVALRTQYATDQAAADAAAAAAAAAKIPAQANPPASQKGPTP